MAGESACPTEQHSRNQNGADGASAADQGVRPTKRFSGLVVHVSKVLSSNVGQVLPLANSVIVHEAYLHRAARKPVAALMSMSAISNPSSP